MIRAGRRPEERDWIAQDALATALKYSVQLSDEQRAVVSATAGRDGVLCLEAGAGTGKTTIARPIAAAARQSGLKVIGLAPSWVAAEELGASLQIESQAIAKWQYDLKHGRMAQPDERTVILVDEAAMVGTRDLSNTLMTAEASRL